MELGRVGVVGRFKPLHNGGALMLEAICEKADEVIIGIGSSNKYNLRNPFTPEESKEMIEKFLSQRFSNYKIIFIPDFAHIQEYDDGQKWREYIKKEFGKLDYFVSGNEYVSKLLEKDYKVIHPAELISEDKRIILKATEVRVEIAKVGNWKSLVPNVVAEYLENSGLVQRFRKEFGLQTLTLLANDSYKLPENYDQEKLHTGEA